ncbi:MAG TPA: response regulator [Polyangia bacterium]|jgi:signal transduction histidine kinase/CheY-like chemotaxis protein
MQPKSQVFHGFKQSLDLLIESVMLRPGGQDAARLLVGLRYFLLLSTSLFLAYVSSTWSWRPGLVLGMCAIDLVVLAVTVGLSLVAARATSGRLRTALVLAFGCDLALEVVGLMSSDVSHSTIIVIPLLTLMAAGVVLEVRHALGLALWFCVLYPLGATVVDLQAWPFASDPTGGLLDFRPTAPRHLPLFVITQEAFFGLALVPFLVLVSQLRTLYRDFAGRLEQAVGRVEAEAARRRELEDAVRQTQKLESLGLLASGIAHDFNNILTGIMGNAEVAAMTLDPDAPALPAVGDIVHAARKAADLCQQMLTYSGGAPRAQARLSLNQIVGEIPTLLGIAVPRRAELVFRLSPTAPTVEGDATQIRQLTMNLIMNAAQALGDGGGQVVVSSGEMTADTPLSLAPGWNHLEWYATKPAGRYAWLTVADTGCGMDQATLARIFDPFFTTKPTGRGLGLSAVVGVVKGHRGFIRVASQPGRGTELTVAFPACDQAVAAPAEPRPAAPWTGGGTVLVVDDEPSVVEVFADMLEVMGFTVLTAPDGVAAVELFRTRGAEIVLVLCDVTMPRMDGRAAARAMRDLRPGAPVIFTSGQVAPEDDAALRAADARFLKKPFSLVELETVVRDVLGERDRARA